MLAACEDSVQDVLSCEPPAAEALPELVMQRMRHHAMSRSRLSSLRALQAAAERRKHADRAGTSLCGHCLSRLYPPFGLEERASKHQLPASSVSRHRLCLLGGEIVESPSAFRASARVLGRVHSLDASTWVPKFFFPKIKAGSHGTRASFPLRLRSGSLQGAVWQQSFLSRV